MECLAAGVVTFCFLVLYFFFSNASGCGSLVKEACNKWLLIAFVEDDSYGGEGGVRNGCALKTLIHIFDTLGCIYMELKLAHRKCGLKLYLLYCNKGSCGGSKLALYTKFSKDLEETAFPTTR